MVIPSFIFIEHVDMLSTFARIKHTFALTNKYFTHNKLTHLKGHPKHIC